MNTKQWMFILLALAVELVLVGSAWGAEQKLWRYPCDVITSSACFRLPVGMTVEYEVPADFGIYTVKESGVNLVTIYSGTAPEQKYAFGSRSFSMRSARHALSAFLSKVEGRDRVDVFIVPNDRNEPTMHVYALLSQGNRVSVARVLSSLRPCYSRSREEFRCPSESAWGQQLADWVLSTGGTEEPAQPR